MGNFMLTTSISSFLETIGNSEIVSKDEILHIHGMESSLEKMVKSEIEFHAFKQFVDEMVGD